MSTPKADPSLELPLFAPVGAAEALTPADPEREVLELFDECGGRLLRYVGSFGIGAGETEDVVQDVFLSLFRHMQLGRSRANLRGWLFRVAHNLALKARKARARRTDLERAGAADWPDASADPEEQLRRRQTRHRLLSVVNALPEVDRQCLFLRAEGLRYRAIARTLGISLGAVSKSLTRSMMKLTAASRR